MKNYYSSDFKLGILGGGQLGRMLLAETQKLDIHTSILESNKNAPCAEICNTFVVGDLLDFDAVYNFGKTVDVLTIEIENVNIKALEKLEKEGVKVYPPTKSLRIIQNKATQKLFYTDNNIPTAAFSRFAYTSEIKDSIANGGVTLPFVWKCAQFGYDGQGVKVVRNVEDLKDLPNVECITEKMIPFKNELPCRSHLRSGYAWIWKNMPIKWIQFNGLFLKYMTDFNENIWAIKKVGQPMKLDAVLVIYNCDNTKTTDENSNIYKKLIKNNFTIK